MAAGKGEGRTFICACASVRALFLCFCEGFTRGLSLNPVRVVGVEATIRAARKRVEGADGGWRGEEKDVR